MKKFSLKQLLSIILSLLLVINALPMNVNKIYADFSVTTQSNSNTRLGYNSNAVDTSVQEINETYINPMYKDIYTKSSISSNSRHLAANKRNFTTLNDVKHFATIKDASNYMRQQMVKRSDVITFEVNTNYYNEMSKDIFNLAIEDRNGYSSNEGDYLKTHFGGCSCQAYSNSEGIILTYTMKYLSTYEQELKVNAEVKNVLDKLNVYNANEYTKIKAVHDYIVKNIKYDYSLSNYSAYNAIIEKNVVCQGFASLTYKMLKELGIGVRFIGGDNHAWNIVRIGGSWYNIDNTWDQNTSNNNISYKYFLKSTADFDNHVRSAEYNTNSFNSSYSMAKNSYVYYPIKGITLNKTSTTINKGNTENLSVTYNPTYTTASKNVKWSTSNAKVATVANGKVTAVGAGTATITAQVEDKIAKCIVTVKAPLKEIKLNKASTTINKGNTENLSVIYNPIDTTDSKNVKWSTSNAKVATVANGKVTAVGAGSTTITAQVGTKIAKCTVTVKVPLKEI